MKEDVHNDEELKNIIVELSQDPIFKPRYVYKHGVLMYDGRLVISRHSTMIPTLLKEFHSTPQGGHSGFYKTYKRLAANVYWVGMKGVMQEFAEYWFNTLFHTTTEHTPFELGYGRPPPVIGRWVQGETRVEAMQKDLVERDEAIRQLRSHLHRAHDRMKAQADKKRSDKSFDVGERIFVKLRAHRQNFVVTRINAKLAARYYGPYPIVERIGVIAYKLKFPTSYRVHLMFHVSLLKKVVEQYHENEELPDLMAREP
ncbi:hypothetical protein KIW84_023828 [Lathyrus oleraceus]|uniref:Integrase zinc-binding domain-containing protein n=1 Tax=Pisum sativum TaxID=3888 RepID=A0A9D5BCD9_PEA|nr:hypothetical protein KIW84_023828 [Pisum sativum]